MSQCTQNLSTNSHVVQARLEVVLVRPPHVAYLTPVADLQPEIREASVENVSEVNLREKNRYGTDLRLRPNFAFGRQKLCHHIIL